MQRYGPAVLRVVVGATFALHGAQKLFGAFGGGGLSATADFLSALGLSPAWPLALALGVVELAGGLLLVAGAFTVVAAAALAVDMVIAVWLVHYAQGFFLRWWLAPGGGLGYEYNVVLIAALVSLMLTGPGVFSIDGRRARSAEAEAYGRARLRAGKM